MGWRRGFLRVDVALRAAHLRFSRSASRRGMQALLTLKTRVAWRRRIKRSSRLPALRAAGVEPLLCADLRFVVRDRASGCVQQRIRRAARENEEEIEEGRCAIAYTK